MGQADEFLQTARAAAATVVDLRRQVNEGVSARDQAMAAALGSGASIAEIAEATGLSQARVGQVLGHPFGRVGRPPAGRPPDTR